MTIFESESLQEGKDFRRLVLNDKHVFKIEFTSCLFDTCDFSNSRIENSIFENCKFKNCNISNLKVRGTTFLHCEFEDCRMLGINWVDVNTKLQSSLRLKCLRCDLRYSYFPQVKMSRSEFIDCKLMESEFSEADCQKVKFTGSDLEKATFRATDLRQADFRKAINYMFHPHFNRIDKAKFSELHAVTLLRAFGAIIEQETFED